jgi:sugar phosphate isomerase/epimerase
MFILSGFADEISDDLHTQLDVLARLDVGYLELRGVWGKNVLALSDNEVEVVRRTLAERDIKVSAIGSPIGKIGIDDPFEPHLQDFQRAIQVAKALDCRYIRIFSFFVPEEEADACRPRVMERMQALLDAARGEPVTLLHENERHIYGDIPRRCHDLFETLASPQLRMTFDPANFVMCDVHPFTEGYELLKDYIDYVHIKDGLMDEKRVVPAGRGDGQVEELLVALRERGFHGFASLEPHLAHAGELSGFSGPELFGVAVGALREILARIDA